MPANVKIQKCAPVAAKLPICWILAGARIDFIFCPNRRKHLEIDFVFGVLLLRICANCGEVFFLSTFLPSPKIHHIICICHKISSYFKNTSKEIKDGETKQNKLQCAQVQMFYTITKQNYATFYVKNLCLLYQQNGGKNF